MNDPNGTRYDLVLDVGGDAKLVSSYYRDVRRWEEARREALQALARSACLHGFGLRQVCVTDRRGGDGMPRGPDLRDRVGVDELRPYWERGVLLTAAMEGGLLDDAPGRAAKGNV